MCFRCLRHLGILLVKDNSICNPMWLFIFLLNTNMSMNLLKLSSVDLDKYPWLGIRGMEDSFYDWQYDLRYFSWLKLIWSCAVSLGSTNCICCMRPYFTLGGWHLCSVYDSESWCRLETSLGHKHGTSPPVTQLLKAASCLFIGLDGC